MGKTASSFEESEGFLRAILESTHDFVMGVGLDLRLQYINHVAPGFDRAAVLGTSVFEYLDPASQEPARVCFERVRATRAPATYESRGLAGHGRWASYISCVAPILDGGELVGFSMVSTDVSALVEANRSLAESQQGLELALGSAEMGLFSWCPTSDVVELHPSAAHVLRLGPSDPTPTRMGELLGWIAPPDRSRLEAELRATPSAGRLADLEVGLVDGRRWVLVKGAYVTAPRARVVGGIIDVTERRQLRAAMERLELLESMGRVAGGIAHDFANLLTVVEGASDLLLQTSGLSAEGRELVEQIQQATRRGADLGARLLAFGRRDALLTRPTQIGRLTTDLEPLLRRLLPEQARLTVRIDPATPDVLGDPMQLERVLMNLVLNARDALRGPGEIAIAVGPVEKAGAGDRSLPAELPAGRYAELSVSDTGHGIPAELRQRIFEPFYSTKGTTGLGLSTVSGIVLQHQGHIAVDSEVGVGSRFRVFLPAGPTAKPRAIEPASTTRPRVLVIDDEPAVRKLVSLTLGGPGFDIVEAATFDQALVLLSRSSKVDLLLSDVRLPGGSGIDLVSKIRAANPAIPVILMTGLDPGDFEAPPGAPIRVLRKPFVLDMLKRTIFEALGSAPPS